MTAMTRLAMAAVTAMTMVACGGAPEPTVTAIEVTPRTVSVDEGSTSVVSVIATYDDGSTEDVTAQVTWDSANHSVAGANEGVVRGNSAGATDLVASWNGHEATAHVEVSPILTTLFGLAPSPSEPGALVMVGLYSDGSFKPVSLELSWTCTRPDLLTISDAGVLQPVAPGQAWIRVVVADMLFSIGVRVNEDLTISIGI